MERKIDRRLQQAELGPNGLPTIEGISWSPGEPLAGTTAAIEPFCLLDVWTAYVREAPAQAEQQAQRPPQRRRRTSRFQIDDEQITIRVPSDSEQDQEEDTERTIIKDMGMKEKQNLLRILNP